MYIWSENSSPKSEAMMELLEVSFGLFLLFLSQRLTRSCKEYAEILYFDLDLNNNNMVL
jgi:hypothetical protein